MQNSIIVRPAEASDKATILAFCQNTFSWGDYIPDVYDDWLKDEHGKLFVALADDQPVSILHVAFIDKQTAWLEGMRVHPDYRGHGVGAIIDEQARAYAKSRSCQRARLVTSIKNISAQKLLTKLNYNRVAQFNEWEADPTPESFDDLQIAREDDVPSILARWQQSQLRSACSVTPNRFWRWTEINQHRLQKQTRFGEVRILCDGFAIVSAFDEKDWNGLGIHALDGDAETMRSIALAMRGEAHYRGYVHLEATVVDYAPLNTALELARYRRGGGMLLYEHAL